MVSFFQSDNKVYPLQYAQSIYRYRLMVAINALDALNESNVFGPGRFLKTPKIASLNTE